MSPILTAKKTNYRWMVCSFLFFATMINYLDRQVLSLTWHDFIAPEFAWTDKDYANITSLFALVYAISMLFIGKLVDILGEKKGLAFSMVVWSIGTMMHALCGIVTCGILTQEWFVTFDGAKETLHDYGIVGILITSTSVWLFIICRTILAIGQGGCFPAAIKATAEYFPSKDRAFAISVFNNGASVGTLIAPIFIPLIASHFGWEMAFFTVGCIGYLWVLVWLIGYRRLRIGKYVNHAEYAYITQDTHNTQTQDEDADSIEEKELQEKKVGLLESFRYKQTWALIICKFMTDGVWWFFLFYTPVYISDFYGYTTESTIGMALMVTLYLISMLSVAGAYLPTYFVNNDGMSPQASRMRAMFIFAAIQIIGIAAVPFGEASPWLFVIVVGIQCASHQSWSAVVFSLINDFFSKKSTGTITGIIGMAGGLASAIIMMYSGTLFSLASDQNNDFVIWIYEGKKAVYMLLFSCFSFMYLLGWVLMKLILKDRKVRK